jgi:hypothetical protein
MHTWTFGEAGRPLLLVRSNAGVAHEWHKSGMIEASAPLIASAVCGEGHVNVADDAEAAVLEALVRPVASMHSWPIANSADVPSTSLLSPPHAPVQKTARARTK